MIAMFRAVLYSQWKWSRLIVVLGTVGAFCDSSLVPARSRTG